MADPFDLLMGRSIHPAPVPADAVEETVVDETANATIPLGSTAPSWDAYSTQPDAEVDSVGDEPAATEADAPAALTDAELTQLISGDDTATATPAAFSLNLPDVEAAAADAVLSETLVSADDQFEIDLFPIASTALVLVEQGPRGPLSDSVGEYEAVDWLDSALRDLIVAGASDVHLNRSGTEERLNVFARIDGTIELVKSFIGKEANVIINKAKTRAHISTTSSLVPADGRIELPVEGFPYRVRAVSLPMFDGGEKLVFRLPSVGPLRTLETMGASEDNVDAIRNLLTMPNGMILIAGPVGEGKTSTAHVALAEIGAEDKVIIAIEDPVERVLDGTSQIEVRPEAGAGFKDIMRYIVRADFDTLFIGEIRDAETAEAAVRIAKAGRRVIATIHAANNITAMFRLIELSNDTPLSVMDAMSGVISQRLVKKIDHEAGGYRGRHAVHEVLTITDEFTDRLIENKSIAAIREAALEHSTTFEDSLRLLVESGITDQAEARRVVGHDV